MQIINAGFMPIYADNSIYIGLLLSIYLPLTKMFHLALDKAK